MAQGIEFNIDARDQATKVLTAVNKKVQDFGKDVGRSIVAAVGPMALVTMAVSKLMQSMEDMKRKTQEAFDFGAGLSDAAAKMNVTVEEFQKITAAADATGESVDRVGQAFKLASDLIASAKSGNVDAIAALEAMGLTVANLKDMKPEDVLRAIAGAMAATPDPANRAAIAIGALGKSAKDLQDILAKGFDIAGALESTEGLTNEEAAFLRDQKRKQKAKENKDLLGRTKVVATTEFLESDAEGRRILAEEQQRIARTIGAEAAGGLIGSPGELAKDERIQRRVQEILSARRAAAAAASAATANPAAADALRIRAENENKREKEAKEKDTREPKGSKIGGVSNEALGTAAIKAPPLTVSSLREIGGALAGESMAGNTIDLLQVQIDLQSSMLKELEKLNERSGDFTKPDPRLGLGSGRVLA